MHRPPPGAAGFGAVGGTRCRLPARRRREGADDRQVPVPLPPREPAAVWFSHRKPPWAADPRQSSTPVRVVYTRNAAEADGIIERLGGSLYGFDLEWKPVFVSGAPQNRTALAQVCDGRTVALFHLCHMQEFPQKLKRILEDPAVQLTGVGIASDAKRLLKDYGVCCQGLVELGSFCAQVVPFLPPKALGKSSSNATQLGTRLPSLSVLVEIFVCFFRDRRYRFSAIAAVLEPNSRLGPELQLNRSLWKGKVRTSNWEQYDLTSQQVDYAANDALVWSCRYRQLCARGTRITWPAYISQASYLVHQRLMHLAATIPVDIGPVVTFDVRDEKKLENVINAKRRVKHGREDDDTQFFLEDDAAAPKVESGPAGKENYRGETPTPSRPGAELGGAPTWVGMEGRPLETFEDVAAFLEAHKESLDNDEGEWEI